jgi:hypothetical protein
MSNPVVPIGRGQQSGVFAAMLWALLDLSCGTLEPRRFAGERRMSYAFSNHISRPDAAAQRTVPPPLPEIARVRADSVLNEADDDMRRLTADIDRVLTGRPGLRLVASGTVADEDPFGPGGSFEWRGPESAQTVESTERVNGWLDRAKRERRFERVRSVMSWTLAMGVAAVISGVAAFAVAGGLPSTSDVQSILGAIGL